LLAIKYLNLNTDKITINFTKWVIMLSIIILTSCAQTKFVPEGKYLLSKVELETDSREINKEEAKAYIRQKENCKILGFIKLYLGMYNLSSKKKEDGWLKRIGEAPQIYDELLTMRTNEQLEQFMNNKGYYHAKITDKIVFDEKKRKVSVKYNIKCGDRYTIKDVRYHFASSELETIFRKDSANLYFRLQTPFDIYELQKKQQKIVKLYKRNGYYYFTNSQVRYLADTTLFKKQAILDLYIGETRESMQDSAKILSPYLLNRFRFFVLPGGFKGNAFRLKNSEYSDTLHWDNSNLYLSHKFKYPTDLFNRSNKMQSRKLYNVDDVENTFNALSRLRQFRYVDIQFEEAYPKQDSALLDCNVRLAPLKKQSVSFDVEGTNTSGNLGVAGNIYFQNRNIFRGAEVFQLRLKGAIERMQREVNNKADYFNTREIGVEATLSIPKLLGPGQYLGRFGRDLPKTNISIAYNYQRRPEYTRTISTMKLGYAWSTSECLSQRWNFLDLNLVHLFKYDEDFINLIENLYIKSSFTDHFIFANNYTVVYNNQRLNTKASYTYARFKIESAGNILWCLSKLSDRDKYPDSDDSDFEYYRFLRTQYAQYIKADIEMRRSIYIDKYNSIVGRFFLGVGFPYGNSRVLPYEKQYFTGGANGIRAWQVRSLGPGTYSADEGVYPNQSSDLKLEGNFEYRFHLFGKFEGAMFVDAGNIWAINEKDNREGGQFKIDRFYKQIAVGTGAGLRCNLNYFILRVDMGLKLRVPSEDKGKRWIIGSRKLTSDDLNWNFAIGYPF